MPAAKLCGAGQGFVGVVGSFGFRVKGFLGFRVLGFRVSGFRVKGFCKVSLTKGVEVRGSRASGLGLRFWYLQHLVFGSFVVRFGGFGFRVQGGGGFFFSSNVLGFPTIHYSYGLRRLGFQLLCFYCTTTAPRFPCWQAIFFGGRSRGLRVQEFRDQAQKLFLT